MWNEKERRERGKRNTFRNQRPGGGNVGSAEIKEKNGENKELQ